MDTGPSWSTVESDPGVFTELIEKMGVTGVQVEELWATDFPSLMQLSPVYGLVFLFKYVSEVDDRAVSEDCVGTVFFANQVIPNACATQAILSILLNIPAQPGVSGAVQLGAELEQFREFTASLPPDMKGLAIGNSEVIRSVHNSFARPEAIVPDEDIKAGKDDDAFHFIAYLPVQGTLYELDGLKRGPIALATGISCEADWLRAVGPHIAQRMERYAAGEVRFNLLAVCGDRQALLQQQLNEASGQLAALHAAAAAAAANSHMAVDSTQAIHQAATAATAATAASEAAATEATQAAAAVAPAALGSKAEAATTAGSLRGEVVGVGEEAAGMLEQVHQLEAQVACLSDALATEQAKRRRWHDENIRRRHNYVPLMFNMLQALARAGQLGGFIEAAKNPATKRARPQQQ